jgi:hypothetical protein
MPSSELRTERLLADRCIGELLQSLGHRAVVFGDSAA